MHSYDYIELAQDNSQHGFAATHNHPLATNSGGGRGGGGGGGGGAILKRNDLDDDEDFVEHSDID